MKDNINKLKKDILEFYEYLNNLYYHYKSYGDENRAYIIDVIINKYWELFKINEK